MQIIIRVIGTFIRSRAIKSYLRSHQIRKLQIGASSNFLEGWLNTDVFPKFYLPQYRNIVFLDARKTFPVEDNTFDYIFNEHLIEHLTCNDGMFMLRECYRVLKPGGRIRIATPNIEAIIGLYTPYKSDLQQRYIQFSIDRYLPEIDVYRESFVINNFFRSWGHQFIYDQATLQSAMEKVGFINITRYVPGESDDKALGGIEFHGKVIGDDMNLFETLVLEAERPMWGSDTAGIR